MVDPIKKKKPTLTDVQNDLKKAEEVAELGRAVPGGVVVVNQVETGIEIADEGIGLFKKIKNIFSKKK